MTTTEIDEHIKSWKQADVLTLANHFHHLTGAEGQYQHVRVHHFEMESERVDLFKKIGEIDSLKICLAINTGLGHADFTFYPVLELTCVGSVGVIHFPLEPFAFSDSRFEADFVPKIFKDMIQDNWNKLDITYIDDLFIAQARNDQDQNQLLDQMVRVHEFIIDKEMIKFINEFNGFSNPGEEKGESNITGINLYPGVDMNKFGHKQYISFTPVLGLEHPGGEAQTLSQKGMIEASKNEIFIEYSRPCPPTCKPPDL